MNTFITIIGLIAFLKSGHINIPLPAYAMEATTTSRMFIHDVPFISQAPNGVWSDPRQEDGCEEASALMAYYWSTHISIPNKNDLEKKIISISNWEKQKYGYYQDTSIRDTADRFFTQYLNFNNYEIKENISTDTIRNELYSGNVVIVAVNGIKLKNPYFRQPGPPRHMIIVIGYDPATHEFITHDPGTRRGDKYRYSEKIIQDALRDYPSGIGRKVVEIKKNMLIIKPLYLQNKIDDIK